MKRLYRIKNQGKLGGVCAGLGEYFNLDPTLFRVIFVLLVLTGGSGILLYLLMWLILPDASKEVPIQEVSVSENNLSPNEGEVSDTAGASGEPCKTNSTTLSNSNLWWGGLLILIGVLFFLKNLGIHYFWWIRHSTIWPIILIIVGIYLLSQNKK